MSAEHLSRLRSLLQNALEVELFTVPPYLTALYSVREEGNREVRNILQGILMEEMLHMALVANVLLAVGGSPCLRPSEDVRLACRIKRREYPAQVPHIVGLEAVPLRPFSRTAIAAFRDVEAPENAETWPLRKPDDPFVSIGQFYEAVLDCLTTACGELGEAAVFSGNPGVQVPPHHYYGGGGGVIVVRGLTTAKDALTQVAQQGEGRRRLSNLTGDAERFGQPKEVAHVYRFQQILDGRYYARDDDTSLSPNGPEFRVAWDAVRPIRDYPTKKNSPAGTDRLLDAFRSVYSGVLDALHWGFNGRPELLAGGVSRMHELRDAAVALMNVPTDDGSTLCPPFWHIATEPCINREKR